MSNENNMALESISLAKKALAEAQSITDVLKVRDAAVAANAWATARGAEEAAQMAMELKLRAERKAGEFIIEYKDQGLIKPGNPQWGHHDSIVKLSDLGVDKNESKRWQRMASIPEERFEDYIERAKVKTQSALLAVAREIHQEIEAEVQGAELRNSEVKAHIKNCHYQALVQELGLDSVDLLITDPPYMTDVENFDDFVYTWINQVLPCIKDTGQAYIFTGAYYDELKTYINILDFNQGERFTKQILVWEYRNTLGPQPKTQYKQNWQAIFYLRGPQAPNINTDVLTELFSVQPFNAPDARHEQTYHIWEKPLDLATQLIKHGSKINDFIFDPFAGTGTFLIAAAKLGRKNIGCDIDSNMIELAKKRGCVTFDG